MTKELLDQKQKIKKKNPNFSRADAHKKDKLKRTGWRRPKGIQNKMRLQKRGYRCIVKPGYRTPYKTRGVQRDGKKIIMISCVSEIEKIDVNTAKVLIKSSVGTKKKLELISECKKNKIKVANFKDIDNYIKSITEKAAEKKREQKEKSQERQKTKAQAEKNAKKEEAKKSVEEKVSEEEKKTQEKKEKDKLLIQKDES